MASISRENGGRRTIQFVGADGKRRSIRLGRTSQRVAEAVKVKIEQLNAAKIAGHAMDDETARWVAGLDEKMNDKLAKVGLVCPRNKATLAAFIDDYIRSRHDTKPRTVVLYNQVRTNLVDYFGPDKYLRDITPGDADRWRLNLIELGLGDNTVRRRCGRAKQFFKAAMRLQLIGNNPFAELKSTVQSNASRFYFIPREDADRILEECPDVEWRLIFALSRFGGLRCPSEHLGLQWDDIDWDRNRITIRSPKTEHYPGGESRTIPLFPELREHLEVAFELADPGSIHVITRYRSTNVNLRTQLLRIIRRAGLQPWPKLFQNLRSTRETELAEAYPLHVVCTWIGNSQPVAMKHYLQVTDEHFERAAKSGAESGARTARLIGKAVQNPVQQPAAACCTKSQKVSESRRTRDSGRVVAKGCDSVQNDQVPPQGLEP